MKIIPLMPPSGDCRRLSGPWANGAIPLKTVPSNGCMKPLLEPCAAEQRRFKPNHGFQPYWFLGVTSWQFSGAAHYWELPAGFEAGNGGNR